MTTWSIYTIADGLFTGDQVTANEVNARAALRPGQALLAGAWDRALWRVQDGQPVEYLPPQPADDTWQTWSLSADGRRWIPSPTTAAHWRDVREARDRLLAACDWTDTASAPARLGAERYAAWQSYRQALRDITLQPDPLSIIWPTRPAE